MSDEDGEGDGYGGDGDGEPRSPLPLPLPSALPLAWENTEVSDDTGEWLPVSEDAERERGEADSGAVLLLGPRGRFGPLRRMEPDGFCCKWEGLGGISSDGALSCDMVVGKRKEMQRREKSVH